MEEQDSTNGYEKEARKTANEFRKSWNETAHQNRENKKVLAGILAIILGGLGIHKFILGYNKEGIILLAITVVLGVITCGVASWVTWVIGLVEGIIYLTKSDEEFYNTYQVGKKPWF